MDKKSKKRYKIKRSLGFNGIKNGIKKLKFKRKLEENENDLLFEEF